MNQKSDSRLAPGTTPKGYGKLLGEIKERICSAQYAALRAVNTELVGLYWDIGRMIVERQAREKWGRAVVERLAADLRKEFPGMRGFSDRNIWCMREFYSAYAENEKLQPLIAEIGWTHNLIIFLRFPGAGEGVLGAGAGAGRHRQDRGRQRRRPSGAGMPRRTRRPRPQAGTDCLGIIPCKDKNRTVVAYALRDSNKPIGVAVYRTVTELPEELRGKLPEPAQVALLMEEV